jgi:hypothetical protein
MYIELIIKGILQIVFIVLGFLGIDLSDEFLDTIRSIA